MQHRARACCPEVDYAVRFRDAEGDAEQHWAAPWDAALRWGRDRFLLLLLLRLPLLRLLCAGDEQGLEEEFEGRVRLGAILDTEAEGDHAALAIGDFGGGNPVT